MGHTNCDGKVALFIDFQLVHFHWVISRDFQSTFGQIWLVRLGLSSSSSTTATTLFFLLLLLFLKGRTDSC